MWYCLGVGSYRCLHSLRLMALFSINMSADARSDGYVFGENFRKELLRVVKRLPVRMSRDVLDITDGVSTCSRAPVDAVGVMKLSTVSGVLSPSRVS